MSSSGVVGVGFRVSISLFSYCFILLAIHCCLPFRSFKILLVIIIIIVVIINSHCCSCCHAIVNTPLLIIAIGYVWLHIVTLLPHIAIADWMVIADYANTHCYYATTLAITSLRWPLMAPLLLILLLLIRHCWYWRWRYCLTPILLLLLRF